jgi:hypothetical protein
MTIQPIASASPSASGDNTHAAQLQHQMDVLARQIANERQSADGSIAKEKKIQELEQKNQLLEKQLQQVHERMREATTHKAGQNPSAFM